MNEIWVWSRHSSVGTATRYGLDGPGIEIRQGVKIFRTRPDQPWGPPNLLCNAYQVFPGGKAARAWRWPPTPSSVEVKERVELYLYSPCGPSWPVLRWTSLLPLPFNMSMEHPSREKPELLGKPVAVQNLPTAISTEIGLGSNTSL